jgi:hypothetical protein
MPVRLLPPLSINLRIVKSLLHTIEWDKRKVTTVEFIILIILLLFLFLLLWLFFEQRCTRRGLYRVSV